MTDHCAHRGGTNTLPAPFLLADEQMQPRVSVRRIDFGQAHKADRHVVFWQKYAAPDLS